ELLILSNLRNRLVHDAEVDLVGDGTVAVAPDILLDLVRILRQGLQPLEDLSSLALALENLEFGRLDESLVAASLLAIAGKDPGKGVRQLSDTEFHEVLPLARSALRKAISFLQDQAGIPHLVLLPFPEILVVCTAFFHGHAGPSPRTRELL